MNNQNICVMRGDCEAAATLTTALATGIGMWGITLLLEGCDNNDSELREEGLRVVFASRRLVGLSALLQSKNLSAELLAEYLDVL